MKLICDKDLKEILKTDSNKDELDYEKLKDHIKECEICKDKIRNYFNKKSFLRR